MTIIITAGEKKMRKRSKTKKKKQLIANIVSSSIGRIKKGLTRGVWLAGRSLRMHAYRAHMRKAKHILCCIVPWRDCSLLGHMIPLSGWK